MNLDTGDTRAIIAECRKQGLLRNQAAYVLATAKWETAHTMKPVREYGGEAYLKKKTYYPYVGMGFVQLTWKKNYERAGKALGVDFVKHPKLLLEAKYATPILVTGMLEGWFTGKKLSDYVTLDRSDFKGARRIVNGTDRAKDIADFAEFYDALLLAEGYGVDGEVWAGGTAFPSEPPPQTPPPVPEPAPAAPQPAKTGTSGIVAVVSIIIAAVAAYLGLK